MMTPCIRMSIKQLYWQPVRIQGDRKMQPTRLFVEFDINVLSLQFMPNHPTKYQFSWWKNL